MVWESKSSDRLDVIQKSLNWLQDFQTANQQPRRVQIPKQMLWELPREGWVKLSVDGTFKLKEG